MIIFQELIRVTSIAVVTLVLGGFAVCAFLAAESARYDRKRRAQGFLDDEK